MENLQVARAAPTPANVTVGRPREYLTEREVEKLMDAARGNRWGHRDATAILIAYRHGLRASELVALRWDDIDFQTGNCMCGGPRAAWPERRSFALCAGSSGRARKGCMSLCLSAWRR